MRFLAVIFMTLVASTAFPDSGGPVSILEELGALLKSREAWKASYVQEYIPAGMDLGEEVSGELRIAWPDHALFLQKEPEKRSMGLEGRRLRLVDFEALSCDEHILSEEEWQRVPLIAVLDTRQALEHFSILKGDSGAILLLPHEKGGVERVELSLGPKGLPGTLIIRDPQGAISTFHFTGWKAVKKPAGESWLPEPPEGVGCVGDQS